MQGRQAPVQAGHQKAGCEAPGSHEGEWPSCRGQSKGLPRESWLEETEYTASTPEWAAWGDRGMRQRQEMGQRSTPLARALLALIEALYVVVLDQTNEHSEADKGTKTHRETESTHHSERETMWTEPAQW